MGNEKQKAKAQGNDSTGTDQILRPRCPYYDDVDSDLTCPYFMIANIISPSYVQGKQRILNWAGIASLILGIVAMSLCWLGMFFMPALIVMILSILAIIFGAIGMRISTRTMNGRVSSGAGLTLGILALIFTIFFLMLFLLWR